MDIRFEIYGSDGSIFIDATREIDVKVFKSAPGEKVVTSLRKQKLKRVGCSLCGENMQSVDIYLSSNTSQHVFSRVRCRKRHLETGTPLTV